MEYKIICTATPEHLAAEVRAIMNDRFVQFIGGPFEVRRRYYTQERKWTFDICQALQVSNHSWRLVIPERLVGQEETYTESVHQAAGDTRGTEEP